MKRLIALLLASSVLSSGALAGDLALGLKQRSVVDGPVVRLSDLFEGLDSASDASVDQAPAPGQSRTYTAGTLSRLAKLHGLDWQPANFLDKVVVERDSESIQIGAVTESLRRALSGLGLPRDVDIELFNRRIRLFAASGDTPRLEVDDLFYDPVARRFEARITVTGPNGRGDSARVAGAVHYMIQVPMLKRMVGAGDTVRKEDLVWKRMRQGQVVGQVLTSPEQIVGRVARRPLTTDLLIRDTDLKENLMVQRNTPVTILFKHGAMTITAQGRAQSDGAEGAMVKVLNTKSNRVLDALVIAPNLVAVGPRPTLAMN
ncbi:MAG: hypothetical protein OHK0024_21020 [Thalassobaculales bacterium]